MSTLEDYSRYDILPALDLTRFVHDKICIRMHGGGGGDQNLNFQNVFHRVCNEIRMKIQSDKYFRNPTVISTTVIRVSTFMISACYDKAHLKILSCKRSSFRGGSLFVDFPSHLREFYF